VTQNNKGRFFLISYLIKAYNTDKKNK